MKEIYITILYVMARGQVCPNAYLTRKKHIKEE